MRFRTTNRHSVNPEVLVQPEFLRTPETIVSKIVRDQRTSVASQLQHRFQQALTASVMMVPDLSNMAVLNTDRKKFKLNRASTLQYNGVEEIKQQEVSNICPIEKYFLQFCIEEQSDLNFQTKRKKSISLRGSRVSKNMGSSHHYSILKNKTSKKENDQFAEISKLNMNSTPPTKKRYTEIVSSTVSKNQQSFQQVLNQLELSMNSTIKKPRKTETPTKIHHNDDDLTQMNLSMNSIVIKKKNIGESKVTNITDVQTVAKAKEDLVSEKEPRVHRDTNIEVWNSKRLEFGSKILKFGFRSKDIIIIVYSQPSQQQLLENGISQSQSCCQIGSHDHKSRNKWSEFIRSANKTSIIAHMNIAELEQALPSHRSRKQSMDFDLHSTTSQDMERRIRVETRIDCIRQYNVELTIFTENGKVSTRKDLLLDVVDHILDQFGKDSKIAGNESIKENSYSCLLKKQPKQELFRGPYSDLCFAPEKINSVHDETHLRKLGTSMMMKRNIFKMKNRIEKQKSLEKRKMEFSIANIPRPQTDGSFLSFLKNLCSRTTQIPKKSALEKLQETLYTQV